MLSPSALARLTGVSTDTLRHYERKGVLGIPARSQGGYRLYPPEAVGRVRLVRRALAIGFTLHDLAAALSERARGGTPFGASARWWLSGSPNWKPASAISPSCATSCGCSSGTGTSGSRRFLREPRLGSLICSRTDLRSTEPSPVSHAQLAVPTRGDDSNAPPSIQVRCLR
jgi:DNA-binding transcriptional MerR regulator